ncbi:hypothetical protein PRBEI_2001625600 [Prionailurus iriomotensis]
MTSGFLKFFCEQKKNKSKKNSYLGSEDIIYSLQKSSREQLDGVQLHRNQKG